MPVATSAYAGEINEIQWQTCGKYKIYYVHRSSSTVRDYINLIFLLGAS